MFCVGWTSSTAKKCRLTVQILLCYTTLIYTWHEVTHNGRKEKLITAHIMGIKLTCGPPSFTPGLWRITFCACKRSWGAGTLREEARLNEISSATLWACFFIAFMLWAHLTWHANLFPARLIPRLTLSGLLMKKCFVVFALGTRRWNWCRIRCRQPWHNQRLNRPWNQHSWQGQARIKSPSLPL